MYTVDYIPTQGWCVLNEAHKVISSSYVDSSVTEVLEIFYHDLINKYSEEEVRDTDIVMSDGAQLVYILENDWCFSEAFPSWIDS